RAELDIHCVAALEHVAPVGAAVTPWRRVGRAEADVEVALVPGQRRLGPTGLVEGDMPHAAAPPALRAVERRCPRRDQNRAFAPGARGRRAGARRRPRLRGGDGDPSVEAADPIPALELEDPAVDVAAEEVDLPGPRVTEEVAREVLDEEHVEGRRHPAAVL